MTWCNAGRADCVISYERHKSSAGSRSFWFMTDFLTFSLLVCLKEADGLLAHCWLSGGGQDGSCQFVLMSLLHVSVGSSWQSWFRPRRPTCETCASAWTWVQRLLTKRLQSTHFDSIVWVIWCLVCSVRSTCVRWPVELRRFLQQESSTRSTSSLETCRTSSTSTTGKKRALLGLQQSFHVCWSIFLQWKVFNKRKRSSSPSAFPKKLKEKMSRSATHEQGVFLLGCI